MKSTHLLTTLIAAILPLVAVLAEDAAKPGRIEKAVPAYTGEELAKDAKLTLLEARALRRALAPLGTEGSGWDIGEAVLFLAGERSKWITGTVMTVDAGLTATLPIPRTMKLTTSPVAWDGE